MSRRVKTFTVTAEGRDKGKAFLITEMSAAAAEDWAMQAFLLLARSGVDLGDVSAENGMRGIAALGFKALAQVRHADLKPLTDQMFACVKVLPNGENPEFARPLVENDIEEVATRMAIRMEVFTLHGGFFYARRPLEGLDLGNGVGGTAEYANVAPLIGAIVSSGKATLNELQTVYGMSDAYTLHEILLVDAHNKRRVAEVNAQHQRGG